MGYKPYACCCFLKRPPDPSGSSFSAGRMKKGTTRRAGALSGMLCSGPARESPRKRTHNYKPYASCRSCSYLFVSGSHSRAGAVFFRWEERSAPSYAAGSRTFRWQEREAPSFLRRVAHVSCAGCSIHSKNGWIFTSFALFRP